MFARAIPAVGWLPSWRMTVKRDTLGRARGLGGAGAAGDGLRGAGRCAAGARAVRGMRRAAAVRAAGDEPPAERRAELRRGDPLRCHGRADRRRNADRYLSLTALLALITGGLLALAGLARLGFIAEFLAKPVLAGYMVGLALVILVGQLSSLLGDPVRLGELLPGRLERALQPRRVSGRTVAFGLASLALILVLQRVAPRLRPR